jgi:flagellar assembly protein FliH
VEETRLLSKSLIKANRFVLTESDPRIVDTNDLIAKKMEQFYPNSSEEPETAETPGGFQEGLGADQIDALLQDDAEGSVIHATQEEPPQPVYDGPSPEEMIAQAQAEIDELHKEFKQGYDEGKEEARQELEKQKQLLQEKEKAMEQEYQDKLDELEPRFIETLTGIYEQIFQVDLGRYKPLLMHIIGTTIRHIEGSRDFLVHVSRTDYEAVLEGKEALLEELGSQVENLEIIEDVTLQENECMIETGGGIYDCGLGTQLAELKRQLKLLSYSG